MLDCEEKQNRRPLIPSSSFSDSSKLPTPVCSSRSRRPRRMKARRKILVPLSLFAFFFVEFVGSFSLRSSLLRGNNARTLEDLKTQRISKQKTTATSIPTNALHIISTALNAETKMGVGTDDGYDGLGEYDPSENLPQTRDVPNVGDPQLRVKVKDRSVTDILKELAAIQQQGPQKYCILGTRHCSYLHQQIIELLAYALVLSGNHVYTSGAPGTNAATVRGALRAEREDLLTVVLPQSLEKQTKESQELLEKVDDLITMPQNDNLSLDVASRICNSYLLGLTDQLISFAFHESTTVIEANKEAKALDMLVTTLYLD